MTAAPMTLTQIDPQLALDHERDRAGTKVATLAEPLSYPSARERDRRGPTGDAGAQRARPGRRSRVGPEGDVGPR